MSIFYATYIRRALRGKITGSHKKVKKMVEIMSGVVVKTDGNAMNEKPRQFIFTD